MALLAILAVARGRPVGRDRLIALLWPDHPAEAARHTLSESLSVLRRELGDLFVTLADEVALNPDVAASDVEAFEGALEAGRLEEAVAAYGGPLLDGFHVTRALEFERWVDGERDRLARACARALESLATAAEAAGNPVQAVEWWRRLAAHDPYSSRTALGLTRALDAAGEPGAALRAAAAHAALLREDLGVEPDPALAEVVERLRAEPARIPSLSPPRPAAAPADEPPATPDLQAEPSPAEEPSLAPPPADEPRIAPSAGTDSPPSGTAKEDGAAPAVIPPRERRTSWRRPLLAGGMVLAALVMVLAVAWFSARDAQADPRYDPRRIAVLYFDDHSPGGELGYLASGLTEMLIHELSQAQALDVVSRNGVKRYREHAVAFDSLAADLRAGTVVEGSVQRSGGRVRVTVQLIDANTQTHLESRTVEHPEGALFALQDAVTREVSGFLRRRVGRSIRLVEMERRATSPRALELVLRAVDARERAGEMARSPHPRDVAAALRALDGADSLLVRAAALDARWAEPAIQQGWVAVDRARLLAGADRTQAYGRALPHADDALRIEPGNVDARELRGTTLWRLAEENPSAPHARQLRTQAERDLRAVLSADPDRAAAWVTLSQLLRLGGGLAEAEVAARRAREADAYLAVNVRAIEQMYRASFAFEDFSTARHWCGEGRREAPADYRFWECELAILARDPGAPARPDSAWRLVAALDRMDPAPRALAEGRAYSRVFRRMMAAAVLARAGLADSARAVAARARSEVQSDPVRRASFYWDEAYLRLLLGERARSAALLDTFVSARPELREYVARERVFRGLRE